VRPRPAGASSRIYLSPPHVGREERALVEEAFDSNWVAPLGPQVDAFESEFAAATRGGHAAALSSGTAALHLALRRLGIGRGDEVLCSTLTFVASANPIVYEGATPVFVDSDEQSWNMDPALLAAELDDAARRGRLPSAVVLVHLYGQSADVAPILEACDRHGVPLVEDAAEALGARYRGRSPGTFGRFGAMSDQCASYGAPSLIHCFKSAICCAVSFLSLFGGGMISSGSFEETRDASSLCSTLPGTMARTPSLSASAPSRVSSRRSALRAFLSGPWHA